jgi:hypothetical protein
MRYREFSALIQSFLQYQLSFGGKDSDEIVGFPIRHEIVVEKQQIRPLDAFTSTKITGMLRELCLAPTQIDSDWPFTD